MVSSVSAQQKAKSPKFDESAIVKSEDGDIFSYAITQRLLQTKAYSLKFLATSSDGRSEFLLYKLSKEQQELNEKRRIELIATQPKPKASEVFKEGAKFRFDKMKDIKGNKYDFKNNTEKVVVFNFWFINCPPCKREIPELNDLVSKYKDNNNVVFIAIALDDEQSLKQFLKAIPFDYNVVDDGRFYADKYGVRSYPTHVVVGKDNLIRFSSVGLTSNTIYWIDRTIQEAL